MRKNKCNQLGWESKVCDHSRVNSTQWRTSFQAQALCFIVSVTFTSFLSSWEPVSDLSHPGSQKDELSHRKLRIARLQKKFLAIMAIWEISMNSTHDIWLTIRNCILHDHYQQNPNGDYFCKNMMCGWNIVSNNALFLTVLWDGVSLRNN